MVTAQAIHIAPAISDMTQTAILAHCFCSQWLRCCASLFLSCALLRPPLVFAGGLFEFAAQCHVASGVADG